MVEVATKRALNPFQLIGNYFGISFLKSTAKFIELPLKLIVPSFASSFSSTGFHYSVLGLGDITIPGLLISLAREMDVINYNISMLSNHSGASSENNSISIEVEVCLNATSKERNSKKPQRLFTFGLIGYCIGLGSAFIIGRWFQHAQPALLYLVPSVIVFISLRAIYEKRFMEIWNGPKNRVSV
jgi:hypothetical protein